MIDGLPLFEDWLIETLSMPTTDPLTQNFDALGYESTLFVLNMGSLMLVFALFPVFISILVLLRCSMCRPRVRSKANEMLNRTFFNSVLRFTEETYLITTLCSLINLRYVIYGGATDFNYVLAIAALLISAGHPTFISCVYLFVRTDAIKRSSFKKRVGVFYEDINLRGGRSGLKWPLYETFQKFALAYVMVFSIDYPYA